jgi:hypothetical protein
MPSPFNSIYIIQNDLLPLFSVVLTDPLGNPVDLSLASAITFRMTNLRTGVIQIADQPALNLQTNPSTMGQVQYQWQVGDTAIPGIYRGSFTVTINTKQQTYPKDDSLLVNIGVR